MIITQEYIYFVLSILSFDYFVSGLQDNRISTVDDMIMPNIGLRYPRRSSNIRRQPIFEKSFPFPCSVEGWGPSKVRPTSVHNLRPGDIQVIGAMGDSLVAGNGAKGESFFYTIFEDRGVSFCAGGDGTWRDHLTIPNILKVYNPKIKGFSVGTGEHFYKDAHLNVGFPVSSALDAYLQAKNLVKRMKRDKTIDYQKDWKMITVFFGANDICSLECFNKTAGSAKGVTRSLAKALDYLQAHLPRAFINLIPVIDVTISIRIKRSMECRLVHRIFCMCFYAQGENSVPYLAALAKNYQRELDDLVSSRRYDKRDDFTVVVQPFTKFFNLPDDPNKHMNEVIDISYITYDCFHLSQKGHALAANLVWNNMLEPVGNKSVTSLDYVLQKFNCPTKNTPYFFTAKNSQTFYATGHQ